MAIYVSNKAMTAPGDAPFVPNPLRGLFMNFSAKLDAPNNGQVITKIIARGSAPVLDRTFDKKRGSTFTFPVSVGGSDPYLEFNGTSSLANSSQNGDAANPYTLLSDNFSLAMRVRIHDWTDRSTSGFLRGVVNRTASLRPGSAGTEGSFMIGGSAKANVNTNVATGIRTDEWASIIISYSASEANLLLAGESDVAGFAMAAGTSLQGFGFATNITPTAVLGAIFDMSHFAVWDRSLYENEMTAIRDTWNSGGDLLS
ncbi:hypothetical protein JSX94_22465 [Raoultella ornithinolytica]|uniref:hypothetical protein n=1 Tax=Raoultella ornithinolytica TaxID=54291 RepID=UPI0019511253|nr:hypothetical protein [Raoultella ornithinolytica]MBM6479723.1 hypothetical protein [Raoultella ornithinolytica]